MISANALRRALDRLRKNHSLAEAAQGNPEMHAALGDGVIYAFRSAYEVAIRLLWRAVEDRQGPGRVDRADFRDRIRMALEAGLVTSLEAWIEFRAMGNATSHAYDEAKAREVYRGIPPFIVAATQLATILGEAGDAS